CLAGTRTRFLDHIYAWIKNPESDHALVLFGKAGTGKSSIAHEILEHFDNTKLSITSFVFVRSESQKALHNFLPTLAYNLAKLYPSFKSELGKSMKESEWMGTWQYKNHFNCLLQQPFDKLQTEKAPPIVIVIDALDECGDTVDKNGLHIFLAQNISRLPSNIRVLITSRTEEDI
ncbi:hypothetical protein FA95DRAFT_1465648, partial [Auriscalpium vulgare]